jgi:hypothetical protein
MVTVGETTATATEIDENHLSGTSKENSNMHSEDSFSSVTIPI